MTFLSGCVTAPLPLDKSPLAVDSGDATAIIEGCGHQPVVGYTYCRKMEDEPAADSLVFITPPVKCAKASCAYIKIFNPAADQVISFNVLKGQTRSAIAWNLLIGREKFTLQDRGFWPFTYQMIFTDDDGFERTLVMEGEIRLRVYKKGYLPLNQSQSDLNFAWEFFDNGRKIKITSGGRSYVAPVGQ